MLNAFTTLFFACFYRASGNHELTLAISFHNRRTPEFEETIGLLMEVLPLRIRIKDGETLRSLNKKVTLETIETLQNRQYPIRNPIQSPIYEVLLNFHTISFTQFLGNSTDFIGHIGGDDFVIMTTPDKGDAIADEIVAQFDTAVWDLYEPEDRDRGYIEVPSRKGVTETFSLVSVTIAAVTNQSRDITHFARLNDLVSELKRYGKSVKGSIVVSERRSGSAGVTPAKVGTSGGPDAGA